MLARLDTLGTENFDHCVQRNLYQSDLWSVHCSNLPSRIMAIIVPETLEFLLKAEWKASAVLSPRVTGLMYMKNVNAYYD